MLDLRFAVLLAAMLALGGCAANVGQKVNQKAEKSSGPPIMVTYDNKIVYTTDMDTDPEPLREDCRRRGGIFNECGDICPPGTFICEQVCAYTCELGSEQAHKDETVADSGPPLPEGFRVYRIIGGLSGAIDFAGPDLMGNCWVARPGSAAVTMISTNEEGDVVNILDVYEGLSGPHALALAPGRGTDLYFASSGSLCRAKLYSGDPFEVLDKLPEGLASSIFGADGRLYIHAGGDVLVLNRFGKLEKFAEGPAGQGGMAVDPVLGDLWIAGGDGVYVVHKNNVELRAWLPDRCGSASMEFVPETGWPVDLALDLLVSCPGTGDILRLDLDAQRLVAGLDFFMTRDWRPYDMELSPGGFMRFMDSSGGWLILFDRIPEMEFLTSEDSGFNN